MKQQSIEMILVNDQGQQIDEVTLEIIIVINHQRYAVLRLEESITFSKMFINENGDTQLRDINDEAEFKYVESVYYSQL